MKTLICGFDDSNHAGDRKGDIITGVFSENPGDANVVRFRNRRDREFFRNWFANNFGNKDYRFAALHDDELRRIQPNLPLVAPSLIDNYLSSTRLGFNKIQIYFDGILKKWHKEFLEKIRVELKISKNSDYTIRNYLKANKILLDFTKKNPDQITEDDIKLFMSEKISDKASTSVILFLSAVRYAYL